MTFRELNDRNYFEVNGIHVEIMLPETVALAIPENKPGAISPVDSGCSDYQQHIGAIFSQLR